MPVASEGVQGDLPSRVSYLKLDSKKRAAGGGNGKQQNIQQTKKKKFSPDSELKFNLETCSKTGDVAGALELYDRARKDGAKLIQYHYNVILYLCSSAALGVLGPGKSGNQNEDLEVEDAGILFRGKMAALVPRQDASLSEEVMQLAQRRGLEIYTQMKLEGVPANEAAFTSLARLAVAKRDGDLAFSLVKEMAEAGITPKLRSYGPALYTYLKNNQVEKAFEVDDHMRSFGVQPEEMELQILLELSSRAGLEKRVYSVLHRLRRSVRKVSSSTARSVERWFASDAAAEAGSEKKSEDVKRALELRGGGGHELGWIGKGRWSLRYTSLDGETGVCGNCKQKMAAVDVDLQETEDFSKRLAALACEKERDSNAFKQFQEWLDEHGPFDAIVDGANIALFNQNFAEGGFSFAQLDSVVGGLQKQHGKLPLIILHNRRVSGGPAAAPEAHQLLKQWREANALFTAATGSNDDWYWLYAAVKCNALLISNDEMRDHLFQLLGDDFFPRWKERHQVRFGFSNGFPSFELPSPYSTVIQESEKGAWHLPISGKDSTNTLLCAMREELTSDAGLI